jgi:hypothetical protein
LFQRTIEVRAGRLPVRVANATVPWIFLWPSACTQRLRCVCASAGRDICG